VPIGNTNVARVGDDGVGLMTISNAAVRLNNLSVGRHTNSFGTLVIHDSGLLDAQDDVSIGRFGGATGTTFMAGGELRCTNRTLWVGREGRGKLIVSNGVIRADNLQVASLATNGAAGDALLAGGSTVLASNFLIGAAGFATGEVVIAGGTLVASNAARSALTEISSGLLTLQGGSLVTDRILLTNSAGRMQFNAGTVRSSSSFVSNGLPFVVGDGVHAATFVLGEGRHVFANGIQISPNSTLTGCNDILGTVINNGGTITTTNCPTAPEPPEIASVTHAEGVTQVKLNSVPGLNYVLEYKDQLDNPAWTPLGSVPGNGAILTLLDPAATAATRFYRVRVE
jgi:hypothetical protein